MGDGVAVSREEYICCFCNLWTLFGAVAISCPAETPAARIADACSCDTDSYCVSCCFLLLCAPKFFESGTGCDDCSQSAINCSCTRTDCLWTCWYSSPSRWLSSNNWTSETAVSNRSTSLLVSSVVGVVVSVSWAETGETVVDVDVLRLRSDEISDENGDGEALCIGAGAAGARASSITPAAINFCWMAEAHPLVILTARHPQFSM